MSDIPFLMKGYNLKYFKCVKIFDGKILGRIYSNVVNSIINNPNIYKDYFNKNFVEVIAISAQNFIKNKL